MKIPAKSNPWLRILSCCLMAALAVLLIDSGMNRWSLSLTVQVYLFGFLYSVCITAFLSPSAHRVWKLTSSLPIFLRWTARAAWVALGTAAGCLLAGLVRLALAGSSYPYWTAFKESYGIAIVLSVFATTFAVVYERFRAQLETTELQLKEKEVEREKALKLATEATLSSLESRLHPHFLFNTINSIASLIQDDPARAEKMLSQMADLLRFSLDSARSGLVPLSRELKIVRDYLEIEKARFESRLRYDINVPAELEDLPFPPLSLQTLVENSVKYAVSVTRAGADILIYAHLDSSSLVLTVEDNGPGFAPSNVPSGHGLASLTARLESLYGQAAQLEISSQAGRTRVSLHVPAAVPV